MNCVWFYRKGKKGADCQLETRRCAELFAKDLALSPQSSQSKRLTMTLSFRCLDVGGFG